MKKLFFVFLIFITSGGLFLHAQVSGTICAGNSAILTNTAQGLTSVTQSINPGGSTGTGSVVSFTISPLATTIYTVYANGLDATNTPTTLVSTFSITVNPQPTIATTYTQSTCTNTYTAFDMHLTFIGGPSSTAYTVTWADVNGNPSTPAGLSTSSTSANESAAVLSGIFNYTIVADGGCGLIGAVTISPQPAPAVFTISPIGTNVYSITCTQPAINISATNPTLTYAWSNVNAGVINGTVVTANATTLGTWSVTGTNPSSNCTATKVFSIVLNTTPPTSSVSPTLQQLSCTNSQLQTVTLTAISPTANAIHYVSDENGQTVSFNGAVAIFQPSTTTQVYTYVLVNAATGCSATAKSFTVTSSTNSPTFNVSSTGTLQGQGGYTVGCNNHSLTVLNIVNPNTNPVIGGAIQFGYLQPGTTATVPVYSGSQSTVISTPGTWTLVVKDIAGNCETRVPVTVIQNTIGPDRSAFVPTQILDCFTPSTVLQAQTTNSAAAFSWTLPTGGNNIQSATVAVNTTTNPNSPTIGNYTLGVTDLDNGCISTSVVPMSQNLFVPTASVSVTNRTLTCITTSLQLSNSSKTGIPASTGFPTVGLIQVTLWEGPVPQPTMALVSSYMAGTPGTYTMTVKDLNNGCSSYTTIAIGDGRIYPNLLQPSPIYTLDCGAKQASITPLISDQIVYSYAWSGPPTNSFVGSSTVQVANVTSTGFYTVVVTNPTNGCSKKDSLIQVVNGSLTGSITPDKTSGYAPLTVNFTNNSTSSQGNGSITSVWDYGNGVTITYSDVTSGQATYKQPGSYKVTLFTAKGTCRDVNTVTIEVDIPSKLEVPNVFTPNGDGVNDLFFLKVANLTQIQATIFDRWGHEVYKLDSETGNIEWDGKNIYGKDAAAGTYFYIITATGKDGANYDKKGTITLVR